MPVTKNSPMSGSSAGSGTSLSRTCGAIASASPASSVDTPQKPRPAAAKRIDVDGRRGLSASVTPKAPEISPTTISAAVAGSTPKSAATRVAAPIRGGARSRTSRFAKAGHPQGWMVSCASFITHRSAFWLRRSLPLANRRRRPVGNRRRRPLASRRRRPVGNRRCLLLANGRLRLGPTAPLVPHVAGDDLHHAGDRDGQQRAENARELDPDEDADQHDERVQLDRAGQDDRLEQVVFQLL